MSTLLSSRIEQESPVPKYWQIAQVIRRQIDNKILSIGDKLSPERELSKQFGVSYFTIRQALTELEKQGLVKRRHGSGNFVSSPEEPTQRQIQFVFFNLDLYVARIIEGIEDVAFLNGHRLFVRDCDFDLVKEKKAIQETFKSSNAGLILYPGMKNSESNVETLRCLRREEYPFVLVDRFFEDLDSSYVVTDDFNGGHLATSHLADLGHKHIFCLASANIDSSSVRNRIEGYKQALKLANIPLEDYSIRHLYFSRSIQEDNIEDIRYILREWLRYKTGPIAVFATGDIIAIVILRIAFEIGLRVPEDIAVVGYGDIDTAALQVVPLTTIKIPMREIGAKAIETLLDQMKESKDPINRKIVLPPLLVVRSSCGADIKKGV